jgi:protoheme IX farnesyltransferase
LNNGLKDGLKPYLALTKPRITWLILMSTGVGFYFGAKDGWTWLGLLHTLVGTGLIASGTAALNQWYESEADAKMKRTENRPLPLGLISRTRAFWFAVALSAAGFVELGLGTNWLTAGLGLFTLASYLFAYTPLKRRTPHSTTVGAIPGAMPPLIGYAAAYGSLTREAWALYAILFVWQFPHFYAIAWMYREDYGNAGIQMLPVLDRDGVSTARWIGITSLLLIPVSLAPVFLGMTGGIYLAGAIVMGLLFLYRSLGTLRELSFASARSVLLASVIYLPVLYGLLLLDHTRL